MNVQAKCLACQSPYVLVINITGMDKIGIKSQADWVKVNGVKVAGGVHFVTCWSCCQEKGIGAMPTSGRGWQK